MPPVWLTQLKGEWRNLLIGLNHVIARNVIMGDHPLETYIETLKRVLRLNVFMIRMNKDSTLVPLTYNNGKRN